MVNFESFGFKSKTTEANSQTTSTTRSFSNMSNACKRIESPRLDRIEEGTSTAVYEPTMDIMQKLDTLESRLKEEYLRWDKVMKYMEKTYFHNLRRDFDEPKFTSELGRIQEEEEEEEKNEDVTSDQVNSRTKIERFGDVTTAQVLIPARDYPFVRMQGLNHYQSTQDMNNYETKRKPRVNSLARIEEEEENVEEATTGQVEPTKVRIEEAKVANVRQRSKVCCLGKIEEEEEEDEEDVSNYRDKLRAVNFYSFVDQKLLRDFNPQRRVTKPLQPSKQALDRVEEEYILIIRNLAPTVSEEDIVELFTNVGGYASAKLVKSGIACVVYNQQSSAETAMLMYNGMNMNGQEINIKLVK